ncbi:MAG: DJ-1/PfpI family protein [Actinomycetia bacterium]|nr:DJ-1/PfpI family protein [Actinomycetes bacterium]MCH9801820.1 DJ-1/PfpI family protein [Actinomycetes bacterium]
MHRRLAATRPATAVIGPTDSNSTDRSQPPARNSTCDMIYTMTTPTNEPHLVALLMFEDMDLLDFGGPYEVLLTANRLAERDGGQPPFRVLTVSPDGGPVTAYGGVGLQPHGRADQVTDAAAVVIPGAIAIDRVCADPQITTTVAQLADTAEITTSICTGAFLLAQVGLLADRAWTTHWEDIPELHRRLAGSGQNPQPASEPGARLVDDGDVITAGGLSCGLDLGLQLVSRLVSPELAQACARQLDYGS